MEVLRHVSEVFAQPGSLCCRNAERPDHLLNGQAEQLSDCRRRAKHAGRRRDVPSRFVVGWIDGIADSRLGFKTEKERMNEVFPCDTVCSGICEQRGSKGWARMNVVLWQCVVVFKDVRSHAIHERRMQRIHSLSPGQNTGGRLSEIWLHCAQQNLDGGLAASSHGTANVVQKRAAGFVMDVFRNVFDTAVDKVRCKSSGF